MPDWNKNLIFTDEKAEAQNGGLVCLSILRVISMSLGLCPPDGMPGGQVTDLSPDDFATVLRSIACKC